MADLALGKLTREHPHDVWANETKDFTPWLAKNINLLSEALGLGHVATGRSVSRQLVFVRDAGVVPGDLATVLKRAVSRDRLARVAARVAHVGLHGEALGRLAGGIGHGSREGGCPRRGLDLDTRDRGQRGDGPGHRLGDGDPVGAALFEGGEGVDAGQVPEGGEEGQPGARLLVPAVQGGDGARDIVGDVPVAPQGIGDGDTGGAGPRARLVLLE